MSADHHKVRKILSLLEALILLTCLLVNSLMEAVVQSFRLDPDIPLRNIRLL